ncbi:hypothetical protein [Saccharopolyspora spinosa]|uniref:Uncharacterized protein n=1 Tax=Saccharopolyspora spinosa TaxID=60894 RepID=A0A2N3Y141_SACSN|nr:hypothetical protein [Saccharopolyspora spinosa]PKW16654.1 hypothetical protein A8926_4507 [Saccharopolyspora spinosa]
MEATAALAMAINNTPDPNVAQTTASEVTSSTQPAADVPGSTAPGEVPTPRGRPGSVEDLTPEQAANYNRYVKKLPAKSEPVQIEILEDGGARMSAKVPSNNIPGSYATMSRSSTAMATPFSM